MSSARSYFNATLYRKHLTRFWPVWALYALIWFFVLPVNLILNEGVYSVNHASAVEFVGRSILRLLPGFGLGMGAFFGLIAAMAVWSYLYGSRSSGLMHALPIRREGLFLTGLAAGFTFFLVPNGVIFLLTLGAEVLVGAVNLWALGLWFAMQTMFCLFFFCFATACGFVTGHILALPAFYVIFNFLAVGVLSLVEGVLHNFVYGFNGLSGAWTAAEWLSPLCRLASAVKVTDQRENGVITQLTLNGVGDMAVYVAAGFALLVPALLLYRRHQAERAGEVVTASWLRPVFKYGVSFCGALAFGSLFYAIFRDMTSGSVWGLLFFLLLFGFLSYLAAEMLLQKSFRVLKQSWKGCVAFLLVLAALTAAMELDLIGYERRVPDPAEVAHVTLEGVSFQPWDSGADRDIIVSDPAMIARMVSLHQSVVQNKAAVERALADYARDDSYATADDSVQAVNRVGFTLSYTLTDGRSLTRTYSIPVTDALLSDQASPAALLQDILNNRPDRAADYFPEDVTASDFIAGSVGFIDKTGLQETVKLSAGQAGMLYEAILEDLNAGRLGRHYLLQNREYNTQVYQNEITLTCLTGSSGTAEAAADGKLYAKELTFYPQTDSVSVIAALRDMGILDGDHVLATLADRPAVEKALSAG